MPAVVESAGPRIYFVGSHATGKTTMTKWVSKRYGLPMITETARAVLGELETNLVTLRADIDFTDRYQRLVFARQQAVEANQRGGFVSDRAFDNLAYAAEHSRVLPELIAAEDFPSYVQWIKGGIVFFVRPHKSLLADDGVREPLDWDAVVRIDGMVKILLELHGIKYLPINTPSKQERVNTVEFVLSARGIHPAALVAP